MYLVLSGNHVGIDKDSFIQLFRFNLFFEGTMLNVLVCQFRKQYFFILWCPEINFKQFSSIFESMLSYLQTRTHEQYPRGILTALSFLSWLLIITALTGNSHSPIDSVLVNNYHSTHGESSQPPRFCLGYLLSQHSRGILTALSIRSWLLIITALTGNPHSPIISILVNNYHNTHGEFSQPYRFCLDC